MEQGLWFLLGISALLVVAVILLLIDAGVLRRVLNVTRRRVAAQDREIDDLRRAITVLLPPDSHPTAYRTTEAEEQRARVRLRVDADDPALDMTEDEEAEEETRAVRRRGPDER